MLENEIKQSMQEIIGLCMDVKIKGVDAFFSYSPHVDCCSVNICLNGWSEDMKGFDKTFNYIYSNCNDGSDQELIDLIFENHEKVKDFLRGLIK